VGQWPPGQPHGRTDQLERYVPGPGAPDVFFAGAEAVIISISGGDFMVSLDGSDLKIGDTSNGVTVALPLSAAQLAGTAWMQIGIVRNGTNLEIYLDGVLISTVAITVVSYSGSVTVMENDDRNIHDVRISNPGEKLTALDQLYYKDDLSENKGNVLLPFE